MYLGAELVLVRIDIRHFLKLLHHVRRNWFLGLKESERVPFYHDPVLFRLPIPSEKFESQLFGKTEGGFPVVNTTSRALTHLDLEIRFSTFVVWMV